jgi:hypothetical protein
MRSSIPARRKAGCLFSFLFHGSAADILNILRSFLSALSYECRIIDLITLLRSCTVFIDLVSNGYEIVSDYTRLFTLTTIIGPGGAMYGPLPPSPRSSLLQLSRAESSGVPLERRLSKVTTSSS